MSKWTVWGFGLEGRDPNLTTNRHLDHLVLPTPEEDRDPGVPPVPVHPHRVGLNHPVQLRDHLGLDQHLRRNLPRCSLVRLEVLQEGGQIPGAETLRIPICQTQRTMRDSSTSGPHKCQ